jgi:hypothetical protein
MPLAAGHAILQKLLINEPVTRALTYAYPEATARSKSQGEIDGLTLASRYSQAWRSSFPAVSRLRKIGRNTSC